MCDYFRRARWSLDHLGNRPLEEAMGSIVVSEFVTLDGVMEDPGGAEGFDGGGWAFQFDTGAEGNKFKLEETLAAGSLLLGRRTYEGFAAAWPERTDEVGFAEKMNSMPKYVVSATLEEPSWNNTNVIDKDAARAVARLKEEQDADMLVAGSAQLAGMLLGEGLVDELRLMIFPIVLGHGKRVFPNADAPIKLELLESRPVGAGVLIATYRPAAA
jgi:dihydrofolate reductase